MGFLGLRFEVRGGGLKLVRIMLEISENKPFTYQDPINFADFNIFCVQKISTFWKKNSTFTQSNSVRAVLEIF